MKADDRARVRDAIVAYLRHQPDRTSRSRIKRLRGLDHPQYRLRVGDIRVFYDIAGNQVEILAVISKAESETWLARFASPT